MPDGTLIQWGYEAITRSSGLNNASVTFQQTFYSKPSVSVVIETASPHQFVAGAFNVSTTGFTAEVYNTGSGASSSEIYWTATGRWKA